MSEENKDFKYLILWNGEPAVYDTLEEVMAEAKFGMNEHLGWHSIDNLEYYLSTKEGERDYQNKEADISVYALSSDNEVYIPVKDWVAEYKAELIQSEKDQEAREYQRYLELHEKYKDYKNPSD